MLTCFRNFFILKEIERQNQHPFLNGLRLEFAILCLVACSFFEFANTISYGVYKKEIREKEKRRQKDKESKNN